MAVMAGFYAGFGSTSAFSQASLSSQAPYVPNFPIPYSFAPINPYSMFDPNLGMPGFSIGNGTILICQLCKKIGHGAKTCSSLFFFGKGGYNSTYGEFSRNASGNGSGTILICQLCKKIGHGAKTCSSLSFFGKGGYNSIYGGFSRNASGNGNGTILICQLCKKIGHGAKTCSTLSTFQQGNTLIGFPNQQQENLIGDASTLIGHERDMHPDICCVDELRPDLVGVNTDRQNIDRLASFNQRTGLAIGDNACFTQLILGRSYASEGKSVNAQNCRSSKRGTSGVINFHTMVESDDRNVTPLGVTCDSCKQIVDHTGNHNPFAKSPLVFVDSSTSTKSNSTPLKSPLCYSTPNNDYVSSSSSTHNGMHNDIPAETSNSHMLNTSIASGNSHMHHNVVSGSSNSCSTSSVSEPRIGISMVLNCASSRPISQVSETNIFHPVDGLENHIVNDHSMLTRGKRGISQKRCFLSVPSPISASADLEPYCFKTALKIPEWKNAMQEEYDALLHQKTWKYAIPDEYNVLIQQIHWALIIPWPLDKSLALKLLLMDLFHFILLVFRLLLMDLFHKLIWTLVPLPPDQKQNLELHCLRHQVVELPRH